MSLWIRPDKGKEFPNKHFGDILRGECVEFQMCKNPDVKCAVVELSHGMIRDRLHKYFTYKNTYRCIDVLPILVRAYNDTVHSTNGMAPLRVIDSDVLDIWKRMAKKQRVRVSKVKISFGQHVRISKEKIMFAKGAEHKFSTEIFRIAKVIERSPLPVYALVNLNEIPIEEQFYQEELYPFRVWNQTANKI